MLLKALIFGCQTLKLFKEKVECLPSENQTSQVKQNSFILRNFGEMFRKVHTMKNTSKCFRKLLLVFTSLLGHIYDGIIILYLNVSKERTNQGKKNWKLYQCRWCLSSRPNAKMLYQHLLHAFVLNRRISVHFGS